MRCIILVPAINAAAWMTLKRIVVDHMAIGRNQRLSQTDNRLQIKQPQISLAGFKQAMGQTDFWTNAIKPIRIVFERPIQVGAQFSAPIWRKHILEKEETVAVESFHPRFDLFFADLLIGQITLFSLYRHGSLVPVIWFKEGLGSS